MDADETEAKDSTPAPDSTADTLEVLWRNVLRDWDKADAHEAFLQLAFERSELGHAAGKYRTQLEDPDRQELAQEKLKAAAMLAMQVLDSSKTEGGQKVPRWVVWVAAGICVGTVALLMYTLAT